MSFCSLNRPDAGNINKIRFYVCPACENVLVSTGSCSIFCCGRKLDQLTPQQDQNTPRIATKVIDVDYFITIEHEMTKNHYILFAAYVKSDKVFLTRLYPEQSAEVRIPHMLNGKLYLYCVKYGLAVYSITASSDEVINQFQRSNGTQNDS
jgi:desulfoferrodoxin (superoxide reductase-like protein)